MVVALFFLGRLLGSLRRAQCKSLEDLSVGFDGGFSAPLEDLCLRFIGGFSASLEDLHLS
jgi:hypothetical protein